MRSGLAGQEGIPGRWAAVHDRPQNFSALGSRGPTGAGTAGGALRAGLGRLVVTGAGLPGPVCRGAVVAPGGG